MKISKHIHSCLLIKEKGKVILIDPGSYSVEGKGINIEELDALDYVLITHEHPDHFYLPFIKELVVKFPHLTIITSEVVLGKLRDENITAQSQGDELIEVVNAPHDRVFGAPQFQNVLFNINSQLTHPGDTLHFDKSCRILALPVQAPWGSLTQAVDKAIELKPEVIIPIHDWHWSEEAKEAFYNRMKDYFGKQNINFLSLSTGEEVEV